MMGKRRVVGFGRRKRSSEDRISLLPDDILTRILSLLTIGEAARTSVLSKRWISVWTNISRLDFDASAMSEPASIAEHKRFFSAKQWLEWDDYVRREYAKEYVKWVNKVLQSHKGLVLDEFGVCCDLDNSSKDEIDKWVRFAFARKVVRLQLNLREHQCPHGWDRSKFYTFPCEKNVMVDFNSLKALNLARVNVCEEVLKFFLQNCKFLEQLIVDGSSHLKNLEVSGPSLALRRLEIFRCCLESLVVCNVNLTSLRINKPRLLVLKNVPNLVDVQINGGIRPVEEIISQFSCCWSKLKVLTLFLPKLKEFGELPHLTELKQLTIQIEQCYDESMLPWTPLIRASPNLENCIIKVNRYHPLKRRSMRSRRSWMLENEGVCYPLQNLKVVEMCGYFGCSSDLELVKYFLKSAVSLEQLVIDCHSYRKFFDSLPCNYNPPKRLTKWERVAKTNVEQQQLGTLVPSRVKLMIL